MSDTKLNQFVAQGTNAERLAFVPDPATPIIGPDPGYFWYETDTGDTYAWNIGTSAWVLLVASSPGTVTTVSVASANGFAGSVADPTTTPAITLSTTVTGILYGNGTSVAAAIAGDFPTLNQNTSGSAASLSATLVPTQGGTGIATYATGDILYASATNVLSKLAAGTNTYVLTLAGGVPTWAAPSGGGTPGGSGTQLQYNNGGAFGGITDSSFSGGVVGLPNVAIVPASSTAQLRIASVSGSASQIFFNGAASTVALIGQPGANDQIITGSLAATDLAFYINNGRMIFSTTASGAAFGFTLDAASAGISWSGSTTGTVPIKGNLSVSSAAATTVTIQPSVSASNATIAFKASNDGYAVTQLAQVGNANSLVTGSAVGDLVIGINGNSQRFIVGTALSAIGFGVAANNGGIFTNAPSGGTSANWKLGSVASGAVSLDAGNYVEVEIGGVAVKLLKAA